MDSILTSINDFKQKREQSVKLYSEIENKMRTEFDIHKKELYKDTPLSIAELNDFYVEETLTVTKKESVYTIGYYIPYFEPYPIKEKKQKLTHKQKYLNIVKTVQSMNVDIIGVIRNITKTNNDITNSKQIYTFYCSNEYFTFDIEYTPASNYYNADILTAKNIKDKITKQSYEETYDYLDIYETNMKDFLNFINRISTEDYISENFGHYLNLPKLFAKNGFSVDYDLPTIKTLKTLKDFWIKLYISNTKGSCHIILHNIEYGSTEYQLYIFPTLDNIKKKIHRCYKNITEITLDNIHEVKHTHHHTVNYTSENDFPELLKSVNNFLDQMNGDYGYWNIKTSKWQNDKLIENYCNKLKSNMFNVEKCSILESMSEFQRHMNDGYIDQVAKSKSKLTIKSNANHNTFETLIIYHPITGSLISYYPGIEYLIDFYGIKFSYNPVLNPWKCSLTIEGKYYDITKRVLRKEYEEFTVEDLGELFRFEGTYDQCFDTLKVIMAYCV